MASPRRLKSVPLSAMALAVAVVTAGTQPTQAHSKTNKQQNISGQSQPDARDAVIADLMRRVEELSRRVEELESRQRDAAQTEPAPPSAAAARPAPPPAPADAQEAPSPPAQQAPGQFEVDEQAVQRALERALVQTGALLLPAGGLELQPEMTYSYDEGELANARGTSRSLLTGLTVRAGLPLDAQIEVTIPFELDRQETETVAVAETSSSESGLSDIGITLTKTVLREKGWRPDLTASVSWDSSTGRTSDLVTLGSGFDEVTAALTAVRRIDPLAFVGGLAYSTSLEKNGVKPSDQITLSLGTVLATSPDTSLRLLFQQSFAGDTEVNGEDLPGTDQEAAILTIGGSVLLSPRVLLDISTGIGLTGDVPDYFIRAVLPIRFDLLGF